VHNHPPNTLFVGQNTIFLPVCGSTNNELLERSIHSNVTEGTVVITAHQSAGRGQRGNTWEAQPAQNLTFSVLFKPVFLPVAGQFDLNIAVALACHRLLSAYFPGKAALKWPNDLYYGDQKMGGILIENTVKGTLLAQSVVGIGLNVNQTEFAHPRAVSMRNAARQEFDLAAILTELLTHLEAAYLQLRAGQMEALRQEYLGAMYALGQSKLFRVGKAVREGVIRGVDPSGRLAVDMEGQPQHFSFKEIAFVWE
jgi:BirA family biotin operon repressor/biotin-[acetyl-CoA-carboxylase] ligase